MFELRIELKKSSYLIMYQYVCWCVFDMVILVQAFEKDKFEMSIGRLWNVSDKRKPNCYEKILSQVLFVY